MSEEFIVYLFGAGASANALPVADSFFSPLSGNGHARARIKDSISNYEKLEMTFHLLRGYPTPDTLAKSQYVRHLGPELGQTRRAIEAMITLVESEIVSDDSKWPNRQYDKRYLNWLLAIDSGRQVWGLPGGFGILTWNYDNALIYAISELLQYRLNEDDPIRAPEEAMSEATKLLEGAATNKPIVHLNGRASGALGSRDELSSPTPSNVLERVDEILSDEHKPGIKFAWESAPPGDLRKPNSMADAMALMTQATCLVVIGYSFPTFNASVDIQLLKLATKLKRVYVQTHERSATADVADVLRTRLEAAGKQPYTDWTPATSGSITGRHVRVTEITNPGQFIIPAEATELLWR